MNNQLDFLFSRFLRDYLDTAESRAAGVPAAASCALLAMDAEDDEKDPRITVIVDVSGSGRARQLNVACVARGSAPRETTAPWLAACAERLADEAALYAYIRTLPGADRTGWQLDHITRPMDGRVQRGDMMEAACGVVMSVTV